MTLRRRAYEQLEPAGWPRRGLSPVNRAVMVLIILSVAVAILDTEPAVAAHARSTFVALELGFGVLFIVEYVARVWASAEDPRYGPGLAGRLRYMATPAAIVDLLAVMPVLLAFFGAEAYLLRLFRLVRVLRLARLGPFSRAMSMLAEALRSRRYELFTSMAIAGLLLLFTSTLLYLVEGPDQPDAFGSIPRAMWWSIVTLTTVGYGDVYPQTVLGKMLAGMTAVTGIGLIAMPTGILAAAFSDVMQKRRRRRPRDGDDEDA